MAKEKIQWHPAFASAIQLEFKEYEEYLSYIIEQELTQEPLKIDVVIIKKEKDIDIDKPIGKILRTYNIFEYKSPTDYVSIDDYYKVKAYAYLYKVISKGENTIDIDDMTISLTSTRYPQKLMAYLQQKGFEVQTYKKGIYHIKGSDLITQILVIKEMDDEDIKYLSLLQLQHENERLLKSWINEYLEHPKDPLYQVIMNVLEKSNLNEVMEVFRKMGITKLSKENEEFLLSAIEELEIDKKLKEEGIKEGIYSVAKKLIAKGLDLATVAEMTELSIDELVQLEKSMN